MIQKNTFYGWVTRLPRNENEMDWLTHGHDGVNPEGSFLYEFNDELGWKQLIRTRLDLEFFKSRPNDYLVEVFQGADSRPKRPVREELKPEAPKVETLKVEVKPQPVSEPVAPAPVMPEEVKGTFPAKRMGRPPKSQAVGV